MPSKKKKYNARFPPARIKKIMQTDEDVGKVAAAVPVIISRSLELFIDSLIEKTASITRAKNAKTLSTSHIKQAIHSEKTFDFLRDLVANVPDHQAEEDGETVLASGSGMQERKPRVNKPRKPREEGARGPGRPRKVRVEEKKDETEVATEEDDEETESDEEQRSPPEDYNYNSSHNNNNNNPPVTMLTPPQGLPQPGPHHYQGSQGPVPGVPSHQFPAGTIQPHPHHQSCSPTPQDSTHTAAYPHMSQQETGNPSPHFLPPPPHLNYPMHNMAYPGQFPFPPASQPMGHMPPFMPHPNMGPYMGPGMSPFPPYMMPGSPFLPPGAPIPQNPYVDGHDPYTNSSNRPGPNTNTEDHSVPLDMSRRARSQSGGQELNKSGQSKLEPGQHFNSRHSPVQGSRELNSHQRGSPADVRSRSRSPVSRSVTEQCGPDGHNGKDSKQSNAAGLNMVVPASGLSNQSLSGNGEQTTISFPGLSDIMKIKKPKPLETNSEDDDYDT